MLAVPVSVVDLGSFRRWIASEEFPEEAEIHYIRGDIHVDMAQEQVFSHCGVKTEFTRVLGRLAEIESLGYFFTSGLYLSNLVADFCLKPDSSFITFDALQSQRVRLVGVNGGYDEVQGSPDMLLQIVSDGSFLTDTEVLMEAYWKAGVQEYWLVDARSEPLRFDIYKHPAHGYTATRKQGGWLKSAVFGKAFRLTQTKSKLGHPEFTLGMRDI